MESDDNLTPNNDLFRAIFKNSDSEISDESDKEDVIDSEKEDEKDDEKDNSVLKNEVSISDSIHESHSGIYFLHCSLVFN